jgi:hypothetical protein
MPRTLPLPATLATTARPPAPIVFGGHLHLGQLRGNDLIVRRTADWSAVTHVPLGNPAAIGALSDGSLVALDATDRMGRASLLIRVAPGSRRPTLHDGLVPEIGSLRICAAREADELACTRPGGDRIYRLKLVDARLELVAAARLRGDGCRIMTSLADGSIVYASGPRELVRAAFGTLPRRYAVSIEPRTLLPGPGRDLLWVVGDELQLCSLAEPMRPLARRPVDVDQVDIAAGGRHLAALLLDRSASAPGRRWTLVCLDARGTERWRRPLAAASLRGDRWVACSARHIAVAGDGELAVFDARTGALVHSS